MKKAKIVCTIGPSSNNKEVMKKMINSGLDVARINMSHGEYSSHKENILNLRKASAEVNKEIAILMDLQGPKIRVEKIKDKLNFLATLNLKKGDIWFLSSERIDNQLPFDLLTEKKRIPTSYKKIYDDVKKGDRVLFDDGLIQAIVEEKVKTSKKENLVKIKIIVGGLLKSNKGINLPDSNVSAPSLTEKDKKDLLFGLNEDIDFIALSFVRTPNDIVKVKNILKKYKKEIPIISKIEKPEAVKNIEEIIKVSDGIMIARGDMAVEMGAHLVPTIQKKIISLCNKNHKPVITATQMLESMTQNYSPTRAEASDVANAIWDGTDAVMLSGETASGVDPVNVISTMNVIIKEAEKLDKKNKNLPDPKESYTANIQNAGAIISEKLKAKLIVSVTSKGNSSQLLSSFRPKVQILAVTNDKSTFRKFNLMWGVKGFLVKGSLKNLNLNNIVLKKIKKDFFLKKGDTIIYCRAAGKKNNGKDVNYLKIETID